ncbi:uncharacterized protein LOC130934373 [Arachis stenosperma]|uniref:uncharacterized protein LOC130934373 n=1 Tax=Arachis stenosperma TaxID=217475 RepID=UPI0025ACEFC2|nr:uncharacterized protein LOC130934373 [Arachis stenosperma]
MKNLRRRGIECPPICERCWAGEETEEHLFKHFDFARHFWFASPFNLRPETNRETNVKGWIIEILGKLQMKEQGFFCTLLNQLWQVRNSTIFEKKVLTIEEEIKKALTSFEEFSNTQATLEELRKSHNPPTFITQKWEEPPNSMLKVNVDAAVGKINKGGVGVVIRDNLGQVMATACWAIPFPLEAHEAEAYAVYRGMKMAIESCFTNIILESDSMQVVKALKQRKVIDSYFGFFIADNMYLIDNFRSISFNHVKR